jgi:phosphoribosylformylglycinamidine synthase I
LKSAVIVFPASNCDRDAKVALEEMTGKAPAMVWHQDSTLPDVDLVVLPGGFSYGDYLRCGAMASQSNVMREVKRHADKGGMVLGICNGFQVLTESHLLPGALMRNAALKFVCKPVGLEVNETQSAFTRKYENGQRVSFPVAHGEGSYFADEETLNRLEGENRVAFRYAKGENPNGSARDIAGIELGIFSVMWSEHCSYKSSALLLQIHPRPSEEAADQGALGDPGPGRERRRHRYRRRRGRHLQDGEPQPPVLHRALSGRGDRRGRHHARRLHHGRAPHRQPERAALRAPDASQDPPSGLGRGRRHRRLRQLHGRADRGRRSQLPPSYNGNILVNAMCVGLARADKIFLGAAKGIGNPVVYVGSKTGRDGIHGATMASAEFDERPRKSAPPCRSAIPSPRSCCWKPAWN